jgi:hypothetical protein
MGRGGDSKRDGGVRPLFWPFGDHGPGRGLDPDPGYDRSVRFRVLLRLTLVWGLALSAVGVIAGLILG